jgi:cell division septation protein DedD
MSPDRDDRGPADDEYEDAEYAEEAPRSIFATTWFRAVLVVVVLAVVGVLALPYLLDWVGPSKLSPTLKGPVVTVPSPPRGSAAAPPSEAPPASPAAPGAATPPAGPTAQMTRSATEHKPEMPPAAVRAPAAKAARGAAPGTKPESPKTASSEPTRAMSAEPAPKAARATDGARTAAKPNAKSAAKASGKPKASAAAGGPFWVQVGAFREESRAKALMAKLRADDFAAEEVGPSEAPAEPAAPASGGGDKYDVFVSGASSDDVNAKLAGKGLSADGVAGGAVVKPSLPLRDAVALSKDLATEGMKVQVRRATPAAPEKATARAGTGGGDGLYRIRVGSFPDRGAAETARKALAAKGYPGFIARGGG